MSYERDREVLRAIEALRGMADAMEVPAEEPPIIDPEELLRRYAAKIRRIADRLAAVAPRPTTPADVDRQFAGVRHAMDLAARLGEGAEDAAGERP